MKRAGQKDVVILAAKRTPFGTFGGALKDLSATDLGVHAARAALAQAGAPADDFGHVVFGNVAQTSADAIYLARHVGLRAGLPERVPALAVNRLCGSGFEAVVQAAVLVETGEAEVVLAGGHRVDEPGAARRARDPLGLARSGSRRRWRTCSGRRSPTRYAGLPMALTAEKLAEQQRDRAGRGGRVRGPVAAALGGGGRGGPLRARSSRRWSSRARRGRSSSRSDEHPRPGTTLEALRKLPKVFKKDGVIHAGAASGDLPTARARSSSPRASTRSGSGIRPLAAHRELGPRRRGPDDHGDRPGARGAQRARARGREALPTSTSSR